MITRRSLKANLLAVLLIIVSVFVAASIYLYREHLIKSKIELNKETLCHENGAYAYHVILIDNSEVYSPIQKADIKKRLNSLINNIKTNEKISFFIVNDESINSLNPVFSKCKIRDGQNADDLIENRKKIIQKKKNKFDDPLGETIESITSKRNASMTSPIFEMIQAVAVFGFPLAGNTGEKTKRLVIFSDLLQNTNDFSFYRTTTENGSFWNTDYFKRVKTDLTGVDVKIFILRNKSQKVKELVVFWESLLRRYYNAQSIEFEWIQG
jgi:hypothetical protein